MAGPEREEALASAVASVVHATRDREVLLHPLAVRPVARARACKCARLRA